MILLSLFLQGGLDFLFDPEALDRVFGEYQEELVLQVDGLVDGVAYAVSASPPPSTRHPFYPHYTPHRSGGDSTARLISPW